MNTIDPIQLLFHGMAKLGPGDDEVTSQILRALPRATHQTVVDAGCGSGRQTLVLAKNLGATIHAVDQSQPFLDDLMARAREQSVDGLIETHCMDMREIPAAFQDIDLLWSEGAVYNIGFSEALVKWADSLAAEGIAVISECSWLKDDRPMGAESFFSLTYPGMASMSENIEAATNAGYKVLDTRVLPRKAWIEGYYDTLETRARTFSHHPDVSVRALALDMLTEIEIFGASRDSYGYVFYVLQRA